MSLYSAFVSLAARDYNRETDEQEQAVESNSLTDQQQQQQQQQHQTEMPSRIFGEERASSHSVQIRAGQSLPPLNSASLPVLTHSLETSNNNQSVNNNSAAVNSNNSNSSSTTNATESIGRASSALDLKNFECAICLQIFLEPHVGLCGHTFCKDCLFVLNRFDQKCPLCRQPIGNPNQSHPNILVKYLILKHFPVEYEARGRSAQNDESGLKLILRRVEAEQQVQPISEASRFSRALSPFVQSVIPIAYDILVVIAALMNIPKSGSIAPRDRLL